MDSRTSDEGTSGLASALILNPLADSWCSDQGNGASQGPPAVSQGPSVQGSPTAETVKNPPATRETREDPLGKEMATHSSILVSLMAQLVKNLPATWETRVRFLGQEDPLEKEMATHSSTLAWKILWATIHGVAKSRTRLNNFTFTY